VKGLPHRILTAFLFFLVILTAVTIWLRNEDYYLLPLQERAFSPRYDELRPSGIESHGYGIIGTAMVFIGVIIYSTRKRVKRFSQIGKIRGFLEFHIFMCLLGPILILYHTTLKFGGVAGAGFWSMSAVVASGIVGRYLYRHIPKNIEGQEVSAKELDEERNRLLQSLKEKYGLSDAVVESLDTLHASKSDASNAGLLKLFSRMLVTDLAHTQRMHSLRLLLEKHKVDKSSIKEIAHIANERIVLQQRILLLEKIRQVFHYWHVIHLPFSIIVLVILIIHVGVAVAFGYTWIF
jgi:hypothetical protein